MNDISIETMRSIAQVFALIENNTYKDLSDAKIDILTVLEQHGLTIGSFHIKTDSGNETFYINFIHPDNPFNLAGVANNIAVKVSWNKDIDGWYKLKPTLLVKKPSKSKPKFYPGPYTFDPDKNQRD